MVVIPDTEGSAAAVPRFSPSYLDRSADPATDFFRFATGAWADANPVPPNKARWGAFDELLERNFRLLREILDRAARSHQGSSSSPRRQVGHLYSAAMDRSRRHRLGVRPIRAELQRIGAVRTHEALVTALARLHRVGIHGLFAPWVGPDRKDSSTYAMYLYQGGLALPDRDYYLLDGFAQVRDGYLRHVGRLFQLAGEPAGRARGSARTVLATELALAKVSRSRTDLRDSVKNYNPWPVAELARHHPELRWREYLGHRRARRARTVIVGQPEFFDAINDLLSSVPMADWRTYLRWQVLHDTAPHLDERFDREDFDFFHRQLLGQKEPEPDWKRAAMLVDQCLGEALGRLFVREHFPPATRRRMIELVEDVRTVVRSRLEHVPWMTEATRARAVAKFDRFVPKIGHPDRFRSYAKVRINGSDHLGNLWRARAFEIERDIARIGGRVDRDEWEMTPPTVNAYFSPSMNEIFFPAGILQPPFFDPSMDDAVNFGAIAAVIGHEITHGYDDQGRRYDADGNLNDWWGPSDAEEFGVRARRIIEQYSRFEVLPGLTVNGDLTQGENIADLGGVSIAFEALARRLTAGRTPREPIDGFTPEQRFFLSYAQIWRMNARPEEIRRRISIDPHSPGRFRVNGVVSNLPEFWEAFGIPEGAPMRQGPDRLVRIW